ncbi:reverse transcriptase domain-containing protein [Tanacetum coccineum]
MLQRCEDTNLVLNWEKCHFMVKEGIVLGHKISKSGIEVDKAKVDVIAKLPHPTTVKAFETLKMKLTQAPILVAPDWDLPFEIMCDASDFAVGAVLGQLTCRGVMLSRIRVISCLVQSIVYTDTRLSSYLLAKQEQKISRRPLSRLENPIKVSRERKLYGNMSSRDTLGWLPFDGDDNAHGLPILQITCEIFVIKGMCPKKRKFFKVVNTTFGTTPFISRSVQDKFLLATIYKDARLWSPNVTFVNVKAKFRNVMRCHKTLSKFAKSLTCGALTLWGRSRLQEGTNIYSWQSITYQNGLKQKRSPPMMPELFVNFLKLSSPDLVPLVQS